MTQGFSRKRSVTGSMDSHGHEQVLYITVTSTKLFYPPRLSSMCMNNLITCLLVVCVCVGSYYLVDSGLPIGTSFLPPHKSTKYHV